MGLRRWAAWPCLHSPPGAPEVTQTDVLDASRSLQDREPSAEPLLTGELNQTGVSSRLRTTGGSPVLHGDHQRQAYRATNSITTARERYEVQALPSQ